MTRFSISAYHFIHSGVGEIEEADIFELPSLRVASSSFVTSLVKTRQDVDFDPEAVRAHFHSKSLDRGPSHHKPSFWPSLLKSRPTPLRRELAIYLTCGKAPPRRLAKSITSERFKLGVPLGLLRFAFLRIERRRYQTAASAINMQKQQQCDGSFILPRRRVAIIIPQQRLCW